MTKTFALFAAAALALSAPAFAQTNTTAPAAKTAAPTATAKTPAAPKAKGPATTAPTTAAGKACSAQADAQNLHGKARKEFRSKCKDGMKPAAPKAAAVTGDAKAPSTAPKK